MLSREARLECWWSGPSAFASQLRSLALHVFPRFGRGFPMDDLQQKAGDLWKADGKVVMQE